METMEKLPKIQLVETDAPLDGEALNYFCVAWPAFSTVLLILIDQIKSPIWKWAAKLGISIVNQIHENFCPVPEK